VEEISPGMAEAAAAAAPPPLPAFTTLFWLWLWPWPWLNFDTASSIICVDNLSLFCNTPNNLETSSTIDTVVGAACPDAGADDKED